MVLRVDQRNEEIAKGLFSKGVFTHGFELNLNLGTTKEARLSQP